MAERFFLNEMPNFISENETTFEETEETAKDSLIKLLYLPYRDLSNKFLTTALDLKDLVVKETWDLCRKRVKDYTLYTGALGTAFLCFKAYQVTKNENDLKLCSEIVRACDSASIDSGKVTFICGRAGVCALGAITAKQIGDERLSSYYLRQFMEIRLPHDLPYELLYGRAGYLWTCAFLNEHLGENTVPVAHMRSIVEEIIKTGRQLQVKGGCPLMFEWHGKKYWGAAHGLAGIMYVLMAMNLKKDEIEDVMGTIKYMIKNHFPSGNYPSSEGNSNDRLVHWCHGAPGVGLMLAKAYEVLGVEEFRQAAIEAAEVVWKRGLLKRLGICHGISGNSYVFLSLYQLTGNEQYLYRAKAFACFLLDRAQKLISEGKMHGGDHPYSLFEGIGGMANLLFDMNGPSEAKFPGYELKRFNMLGDTC